ncbi:MAG: aromatic amino acid hydroxylase [Bacteroidota bacterium]
MRETVTGFESNELIERLPPHLKQFIKPQLYASYSPIDQAVWRYVMRNNVRHLSSSAHGSYMDGLARTGVSIDHIPSMYGMNRILKEIGWAAVAVDGFIPPNAFMEFQAYKILVIASDIRQLEHIEYTPAPDIIHEAAGHAPIIANPDYAEYLRRLGEIGAKAILSEYDIALYEAVRRLSILKESKESTQKEIADAEQEVDRLQSTETEPSEMARIRNLQWWTVEYGLVGPMDRPKIYGAGLLSSIGESKWCMKEEVKKIPYSIAAADRSFDITKPQPQLYVTPDFSYLMEVLEEFAQSMSVRKGGRKGLKRLIESGRVGTIELSTGLQVSGKFKRMIVNDDNEVIYFQTEGSTALAYREKELIGHGVARHAHGFSSPLGKLKGINLAIEDMGPVDLKAYNFYDGIRLRFEFESGIRVEGLNVTGIRNVKGKLMLIQLDDCTVTYRDEVLYKPEYGVFDMAVGKEIVSAFAGSADVLSFPNLYGVSGTTTPGGEQGLAPTALEILYGKVRDMRENGKADERLLLNLFNDTLSLNAEEWLLPLEILELLNGYASSEPVKRHLESLSVKKPQLRNLILEGLEAIGGK